MGPDIVSATTDRQVLCDCRSFQEIGNAGVTSTSKITVQFHSHLMFDTLLIHGNLNRDTFNRDNQWKHSNGNNMRPYGIVIRTSSTASLHAA
jgi:hypothetical protein